MQALCVFTCIGVCMHKSGGSVGGDEGSFFGPKNAQSSSSFPPLPHPTSNLCITPASAQEAVRVVVEGDEGCTPHTPEAPSLRALPTRCFERQAGFSPVDSPPHENAGKNSLGGF